MTGVWQTLIPETPSTEPITPLGGPEDLTSGQNHLYQRSHGSTSSTIMDNNEKGRSLSRCFTPLTYGHQLWRLYSKGARKQERQEERKRFVLKNGAINTKQINIKEKQERYLSDFFTSLVDLRWRYTLFYFTLSYLVCWGGFAGFWWMLLQSHGDIENYDNPDWKPCVMGVRSFASFFLFSLETQVTIGYGYHRMTDECPEAIALLCFQSIVGVLVEALMVGVVLVKLSRPKKRSQTLLFSKNAVVCQRDGQLYLMFRVADIRKSMLLETHVRAQIITKCTTAEGELIPIHQEEVKIGGFEEDEDRILLFWPTIIAHPIDEESPLYEMNAAELLNATLEVIVVMEGVVESTGMTTQIRTSYLPSEIRWGHQFRNMVRFQKGEYIMDFEKFHATVPIETPLCSAKALQEIREMKATGLSGHEIMSTLDGAKTWTELQHLVHPPSSLNLSGLKKMGNHRIPNSIGGPGGIPLVVTDIPDSSMEDEGIVPTCCDEPTSGSQLLHSAIEKKIAELENTAENSEDDENSNIGSDNGFTFRRHISRSKTSSFSLHSDTSN